MFTQPALARSAKASPRSRSSVKTAAVSPNGDALVSSRASSADRTSTTGTTGPNVSSRSIAIPGVTPSSTVGSAYSSVGKPVAARPRGRPRRPGRRRRRRRRCAGRIWPRWPRCSAAPSWSADRTGRPAGRAPWSPRPPARRTRRGPARPLGTARPRCSSGRRTGKPPRARPRWPGPGRHRPGSPSGRCRRVRAAGSCPPPATRRSPPVSTEPTKPTPATPGWATSASPTTGPGPGTKLNTPAGSPASAMTSASSAQQAVVVGAGTQTTCCRRPGRARTAPRPSCTASSTGSPRRPRRAVPGWLSTRRPAEVDAGSAPSLRLASSPAIVKYPASSSTSS